jgi:hypothetical protein
MAENESRAPGAPCEPQAIDGVTPLHRHLDPPCWDSRRSSGRRARKPLRSNARHAVALNASAVSASMWEWTARHRTGCELSASSQEVPWARPDAAAIGGVAVTAACTGSPKHSVTKGSSVRPRTSWASIASAADLPLPRPSVAAHRGRPGPRADAGRPAGAALRLPRRCRCARPRPAAGPRHGLPRRDRSDGRRRLVHRLPDERRSARWLVRQAAHEGVHHLRDISEVSGQR